MQIQKDSAEPVTTIDIPDEEALKAAAREAIEHTCKSSLTTRRAGFGGSANEPETLRASDILFSQSWCSYDYSRVVQAAKTVGELAASLYLGRVSASAIPKMTVYVNSRGEYVSCDNRRLAAVKFASQALRRHNAQEHFDDHVQVQIVHRRCGHPISIEASNIEVRGRQGNYNTSLRNSEDWPPPLWDVRNKRPLSDVDRTRTPLSRKSPPLESKKRKKTQQQSSESSLGTLYTADELRSDLFLNPKKSDEQGGFGDFEQKRPLLAECTNFVTKRLMNSSVARMRLLSAFMIGTEEALNQYATEENLAEPPLIFFKGGTVARLIVSDLVAGLSPFAERIIEPDMKALKNLSDYDFAVVLPAELRKDEKKLVQLNVALYAWLLRFRRYLAQHMETFFPPFATNMDGLLDELKKILQHKASKLENNFYSGITIERVSLDPIKDKWVQANGKEYAGIDAKMTGDDEQSLGDDEQSLGDDEQSFLPGDFAILRDLANLNEESVRIVGARTLLHHYGMNPDAVIGKGRTTRIEAKGLYVTHNPLLEFRRAGSTNSDPPLQLIKFALNRIKLGIRVFFTKDDKKYQENWPGEVVDLSCSLLPDEDKAKDVAPFKFVGTNVTFNSYTLEGYLKDMYNMMFAETGYRPWIEPGKMDKKTGRLSAMLAIGFYLRGKRPSKLSRLKLIVGLGECIRDRHQDFQRSKVKWFDDFQTAILRSFRVAPEKGTDQYKNYETYCESMKTAWHRVSDVLIYETLLNTPPTLTYVDPKFMQDEGDKIKTNPEPQSRLEISEDSVSRLER